MLLWNKINSSIKVIDTKKKFYNQYLYKTVVHVPFCRLILNPTRDLAEEYESRMKISRNYNYGGHWSLKRPTEHGSLPQLKYFQNIKSKYSELKFRVEEPYLSIYSNDEKLLYDIVTGVGADVIEIHKPASEAAKHILNQGEIVIKQPTDFEYKVVLRESGAISYEVREQVYNYLVGLTDTVKMTKGCERNLTERHYWFTSTYFYTKDPSVLTFLNLISPDIVSGIFKLTIATDK